MIKLYVPDHTRPDAAKELVEQLHKLEALNLDHPEVEIVSVVPYNEIEYVSYGDDAAIILVGHSTHDDSRTTYSFKKDGRVARGMVAENEEVVPGGWRGGVAAVVEDAIRVLDGLRQDAECRLTDLQALRHGLEVHLTTA